MKIEETCSCGASISVDAAQKAAEDAVSTWRKEHKHVIKTAPYPTPNPVIPVGPYREPYKPYWETGPTC